MSILNRLRQNGHLDERALAEIWTDAAGGGQQPRHPHLDTCAACKARMAEFVSWAGDLRDDARAEADEVFTRERLAAQQAQIARRIEAAERPARIIRFPRFGNPISSSGSSARRWIASAAAAGLIAGVALGNYMDLRHSLPSPARTGQVAQAPADRPAGGGIQTVSTITDEELMYELEALALPTVPDSLMAFDSMTPRARDYPR